jgi:hypothetical protein
MNNMNNNLYYNPKKLKKKQAKVKSVKQKKKPKKSLNSANGRMTITAVLQ